MHAYRHHDVVIPLPNRETVHENASHEDALRVYAASNCSAKHSCLALL